MSNELQTVQDHQIYIPNQTDWKFMLDWGSTAIKSGMLPESIRTPEAAAVIVLKGRELGLSFMTAIAHIHVIKGKPSMSAELMQAMARKNLPGLKISIVESTAEKAVVEFLRPEVGAKWFSLSFSMEDAKRAELLSNPSWKKYPRAMLWSRAIAAGLRTVCPEALMGISYTPEELGAQVNEQGDVIETTGKVIEPKPSEETNKPSPKEGNQMLIKELNSLIKEKLVPIEMVKKFTKEQFNKESALDLTKEELNQTIDFIIQMAQPQEPVQEQAPWENEPDPRIVK